jgi:hypothetical protein
MPTNKTHWTRNTEPSFLYCANIADLCGAQDKTKLYNQKLFNLFAENDWAFAKKTIFTPDEVRQVLFTYYKASIHFEPSAETLNESFYWYGLSGDALLTDSIIALGLGELPRISSFQLFELLYWLNFGKRYQALPIPAQAVFKDENVLKDLPTEASDWIPIPTYPYENAGFGPATPARLPGNVKVRPAPKPDTGVASAIARMAKPRDSYLDPTFTLEE